MSTEASSTTTVTIGIYLANRSFDIDGLPKLAHPTFNVVPLRIKVSVDDDVFDRAKNIQRDLARISEVENCGVSLKEIYEWTGVKIDSCVNFLKLPEQENNEGKGSKEEHRLESILEMEDANSFGKEEAGATDQVMKLPSPFTGRVPADDSEVFLVSHSQSFW